MRPTETVDIADVINHAPIGAFQWRIMLLIFLVAALDGFDTQAIAFVAPAISAAWKLSPATFGPIFSAGLLGTVVGATLLGTLGDKFGRKTMILIAMSEFALFTFACAHAGNLHELMLYRFMAGIGLGGALPNFLALAAEYAPDRSRTTMVTMTMWGFPFGALVGGMGTGALIDKLGWPVVFHVGAVAPLLVLPLLAAVLPESIRFLALNPRKKARVAAILGTIDRSRKYHADSHFVVAEKTAQRAGLPSLFRDGRASGTLLLWCTLFCSLLLTYCLLNWVPSLLRQMGFPTETAVHGTVMLNFAGILGSFVFSSFMNRGRRAFLAVSGAYVLGAVATALIGVLGSTIFGLMSAIFCAGFFIIGAQLAVSAYVPSFYPTTIRGTGIGWFQGVGRIGSLVGPLAGGMVLSAGTTPSQMFQLCAIPAAICALAVLTFLLTRADQKARGEAAPAPPHHESEPGTGAKRFA